MNVVFEVDRTKKAVVAETPVVDAPVADPVADLVVTPVVVDKKDELRKILDDAGVDYGSRLGEAKLQLLVDALPEAD